MTVKIVFIVAIVIMLIFMARELIAHYKQGKLVQKFCEAVVPGTVFHTNKFQNGACMRLFDKVLEVEHDVENDIYKLKIETITEVNGIDIPTATVSTVEAEYFVEYIIGNEDAKKLVKIGGHAYKEENEAYLVAFGLNKQYAGTVNRFVFTRSFRPDEEINCIASFHEAHLGHIFIGHPLKEGDDKCMAGEAGFMYMADKYAIYPITQEEFDKWKAAYIEFNEDFKKAEKYKEPVSEPNSLQPNTMYTTQTA
jgi:hypothetical protein